MPRTYIKKSNRLKWSESDMLMAINSVLEGRMGYLLAATTFNVPKSSLEDRIKKIRNGKSKYAVFRKCPATEKCVFSDELEGMLVEHIKTMESRLFGLTKTDLRRLAFQLAEKNGLNHPFNKETGLAGLDWASGFLKRHAELSLRAPEPTSAARAMGFNRTVVSSFYDLLSSLYIKHEFVPTKVYNMDETGLTSVPKKIGKIISVKGKKQVGTLASAERGQLITAVLCFSAAGHYIPPLMIFPRVRMKAELLDGAPAGTVAVCHPSGWMQQHIFTEWMRHFISCVRSCKQNPVLLILDGHATHTKNLEAIELARDNGVIMLCLPPHCTHRLQPLDVSFMGPLSTFYSQEVQLWLRNHPGRVVTQFQMASLFGTAYNRAATMQNAISAFSKTGICPLNANVFTEVDFAPSQTTDIPFTPNPNIIYQQTLSLQTETFIGCQPEPREKTLSPQSETYFRPQTLPREITPSPQPGTSVGEIIVNLVSPKEIMPIPHIKKKIRPSTRRGKTAILTESPYKNELSEKIRVAVSKIKTKRKGNSRKKASKENSQEDSECLVCGEKYSQTTSTDEWFQCTACHKWGHESCIGCSGQELLFFVCKDCE